ncbi:MAG: hypothetical protein HY814_07430 [Candidatus Riflebacteria bacterium]|nr:hypothetical protein [Candidatus Riflebacteria bacterium]
MNKLLSLLLTLALCGLAGCGEQDGVTVTVIPAGQQVQGQQSSSSPIRVVLRRRLPPAPGPTGSPTGQVPNLGTLQPGQPAPPPNVRIGQPPAAPVSFETDQAELARRYNLDVRGSDAVGDYLAMALQSVQFYQTRQHKLTLVIQRDPSMYPVAGLWSSNGRTAKINIFQPQLAHVSAHEFAHDLTMLVDRPAGQRLEATLRANKNNPAVFPSSYARSAVEEAMAEALSFWAEKVGAPARGANYNPPAAVVADLQPFLDARLRNR